MTTTPHTLTKDQDDASPTLATVHPASRKSVDFVLSQEISLDGRSDWVWLRLANGDLILGVFPCGDTYFAVEEDARYPGDKS